MPVFHQKVFCAALILVYGCHSHSASPNNSKMVGGIEEVCWFSLIWNNRVVELAIQGSGHKFRSRALYWFQSAELRFPPLCSVLGLVEWGA